jgi:hypothetical protein
MINLEERQRGYYEAQKFQIHKYTEQKKKIFQMEEEGIQT